MNYHFMVDDKFFNNMIEEIEKVSVGSMNEYYVLKEKNEAKHVNHPRVKWIGQTDELARKLHSVTSNDRIFIHWYDLHIGRIILTIDKNIPVYVSLMGGDFYGDPIFYHRNWLFDKKTLLQYDIANGYAGIHPRNPLKKLKHLRRLWLKDRQAKKEFDLKRQTIQRINYILLPGKMDDEVSLVKKIYQLKELTHLSFSFNQNLDLALSLPVVHKKEPVVTIQVGNSATYENNHTDLLMLISKFSTEPVEVVLPFSYGDKEYLRFVKEHYLKVFADKLVCIEEFMPRQAYLELLQKVDVCIMYHNRSQALGNCVALLALGKKVFLKKSNPLWSLFQKTGIVVFDADDISNLSFKEFAAPLTAEQVKSNIRNLSAEFSEERRLADLSKIINN